MSTQTSIVHVRVDNKIKVEATENLANYGLTVSDAVRILLTRVAKEGVLPVGQTCDAEAYDTWFKAKVHEALADTRPTIAHEQVMDEMQTIIDEKRHARS